MIHTRDISDDFFPKLKAIAERLGADPKHMLSVMYSESGCSAKAWNDNPKNLPPEKRWNASGLIQFMPPTLVGLGYFNGHAAFRALSATAQLDYVEKYYAPFKGKLGSIAALYVATFLPAYTAKASDPTYVLTEKNGRLGWAYSPNVAFDANRDARITVQELEDAVKRNCRGPRFDELVARLSGEGLGDTSKESEAASLDLRTILGMQAALKAAGFDPGPLDGLPGPKTTAAILAFQEKAGLVADGVYGPKTRAALAAVGAKFTDGKKGKPAAA